MTTSTTVNDFMNYANGFGAGFLKDWKAASIVRTLGQITAIMEDEIRFLTYLKNSLLMEGFQPTDIELIMGWLYDRRELITGN